MEKRPENSTIEKPASPLPVPGGLPGENVSVGRDKKKIIAICFLIFFATFLVYAGTLKGDFIWDDEYLILNNSQIKTFAHLPNVFKTYVGYGSENINNFYRPVQEISNMIDYFLWGEYPVGFHLTNVVLQALVAVLVFLFLFYLSGRLLAAGAAGLLWGVHTVHTEAIAYIAGRADPLYALFMLLSLIFFIRFTNRARSGRTDLPLYVLSVVFFALSLLSKEIIISMPVIIFLYLFFFLRGTKADGLYRKLVKWAWVPYAAIGVVYGYLRMTVLSFSDIAPASVFGKIPLIYRLLTFFRTVGIYIRLMICPTGLHMERTIPISRSVLSPSALLACVMIIAIGWAAYWTYKRNRLASFAIAWFFVNLLPVSNIIPINSFLAEHWIYMASIGPFFLAGMGLVWVLNRPFPQKWIYKAICLIVFAAILGTYARMTVVRNRDWADEISFFRSTLKYHPRNARLYLNLGNTYYENGDIDKAIEQYRKSIDINKKYAVAYGNIGSACLHKGDVAKAEEYLEKAIGLKYNYPIAHYNLGIVRYKKKRYDEAAKELTIATEQLPQLYQAWNMLGRTYMKLGKLSKTKEAFQRSLYIRPKQPAIRQALEKLP